MFDKRVCQSSVDRVSIPGGRCLNLRIPPTSTPMVFCTPFIPPCFPSPHQRFTCNPCACPPPRACCQPPPCCLETGPTPATGNGSQNDAKGLDNACQGYLPPCPQQTVRDIPASCPTLCTGCKCCRIHANPFPTIQPIQIWGCTPHKFD